mgnify:CR=1 FL=1
MKLLSITALALGLACANIAAAAPSAQEILAASDAVPAPAPSGAPPAALALNGAQIKALSDLVSQVANGAMPYESAYNTARAGFPDIAEEVLTKIFSPVRNFTPAAPVPLRADVVPVYQPGAQDALDDIARAVGARLDHQFHARDGQDRLRAGSLHRAYGGGHRSRQDGRSGSVSATLKIADAKTAEAALKTCEEIDRLESDADRVLRNAMSKLFREETDVRELIKLKAIYELLETITDRCEDVANLIEGVILENS